ncbi:protein FAR1-RELATED SEQUENCE 5-like [Apium graveolens]|uniref:protein FAR1-RELATED SEQUENCE 5-like n=1 Tax=Apium graveolens TaxID=4045 RepID=UPI003D79A2E8
MVEDFFEPACYEMLEELVEGFDESFNRTTQVWNPKVADIKVKPYAAQCFKDIDSCFNFYTEYGRQGGFNVRKSSHKVSNGIIVPKYLVCQKEGTHETVMSKDPASKTKSSHSSSTVSKEVRRRNTVTKKYGCSAKIILNGHNHPLVSESEKEFLRANRTMTAFQRHFLLDAVKSNMGLLGLIPYMLLQKFKNKQETSDGGYGMVFVPFIGIDNHWKSCTFASALLNSENESNFMWSCEMLLKVFPRPPKCIITDQCPAMKVEISKIFPGSIHRYCMWHIMQKFPGKVGPVFYAESGFMDKLNKFVWSSHLTVAEFEQGWNSVLNEFGLSEHIWLKDIYAIRKSWIPAFFWDKPMGALLRTISRPSGSGIILPPLQINNKGSRKRIASAAELSRDGKKRKLRICKTCNTEGYHDSRKCPTKSIHHQNNSSLQNAQIVLNQGNVIAVAGQRFGMD